MKKFFILKGLGFLVLGTAAVAGLGFILMSLWNWLVPVLFSGPIINFWQAIGLFVLSKILFGFGGRGCRHHGHRGPGVFWKRRMEEKLSKMSPEEREKIKARFRNKCSPWHNDFGKDENKTNDGTQQ